MKKIKKINFRIFSKNKKKNENIFGKPFPGRCQKWLKIRIFMQKSLRKLSVELGVTIWNLEEKKTPKNIF